jgi:hypothetical protein
MAVKSGFDLRLATLLRRNDFQLTLAILVFGAIYSLLYPDSFATGDNATNMARTLAMMTLPLSDRLSDDGSIAGLHPISLGSVVIIGGPMPSSVGISSVVLLGAVLGRLDLNTKTNLIITKKQLCRHKLAAGSN